MTLNTVTHNFHRLLIFLGLLTISGCIEPHAIESFDFDDRLVVEATITDQLKQQKVIITRTVALELDSIMPESGALVQVATDQHIYPFYETTPGVYLSNEAFAAQPNTSYQLMISTGDNTYRSKNEVLTEAAEFQDLSAGLIQEENGDASVGIFVDGYSQGGNSRNYRYTYEETYKLVAPLWTDRELIPTPGNSCTVDLVNDEKSLRECYRTEKSNSIIQYSTSKLAEDKIDQFMVRKIDRYDHVISYRYSILVRQHVQSNEAYAFYEALNTFSEQESVFSGAQPGFFQGNIVSTENPDEKVIGFFEVASVSEKRLFFNYTDFFPGELGSSYASPCVPYAPPIVEEGECVLRGLIEANAVRFVSEYNPPPPTEPQGSREGPYLIVARKCGDCSEFGEAKAPEFWIE